MYLSVAVPGLSAPWPGSRQRSTTGPSTRWVYSSSWTICTFCRSGRQRWAGQWICVDAPLAGRHLCLLPLLPPRQPHLPPLPADQARGGHSEPPSLLHSEGAPANAAEDSSASGDGLPSLGSSPDRHLPHHQRYLRLEPV